MNKYDSANRKYHRQFIQAWYQLDGKVAFDMMMHGFDMIEPPKDIHCYHPEDLRPMVRAFKQVEMQYEHVGKRYLAEHYPLMVRPWPKAWFTDFGRAYQAKRRKQYQHRHDTITSAQERAMHEPN